MNKLCHTYCKSEKKKALVSSLSIMEMAQAVEGWGAKSLRAASVRVQNWKHWRRSQEKKTGICASGLEGAGGVGWRVCAEWWNWRRIKWTLGFRRWREGGCFERRSGAALLALKLGLRHASQIGEPLESGTREGSEPNLCYSVGVGSDKS